MASCSLEESIPGHIPSTRLWQFPAQQMLMKEKGLDHVLLTGGGIIPEKDIDQLEKIGAGRLFGPGTPTTEIIEYIRDWSAAREN